MLAKEMKIKCIKQQREFIERQLNVLNPDGDPSYSYHGQLLPEVASHFKKEGYDIRYLPPVNSPITKGIPIYLFTIRDDVVLSEEELEAAEKVPSQTATRRNSRPGTEPVLFSSLVEAIMSQLDE